jgi:hypothetical protein
VSLYKIGFKLFPSSDLNVFQIYLLFNGAIVQFAFKGGGIKKSVLQVF